MRHFVVVVVGVMLAAPGGEPVATQAARVDFARDIQPMLREHCVGCHGPTMQQAGYRLDRRSGALRGLVRPNIIPGSSTTSRLYIRVSSTDIGPQMPPTGALAAAQIAILKRWIDEGADWPDALANEVERPVESTAAVQVADRIRASDRKAVLDRLRREPGLVNAPGPGGATPLMLASLYGNADLVAAMVKAGGDPNLRNNNGATALMWALHDVQTVRVLLDAGADPNATSDFARAPLELASGQPWSEPVVALLLERGAMASPAALNAAAAAGNAAVTRRLLAAGARNLEAAASALRAQCRDCLDALVAVHGGSVPGGVRAIVAPSAPAREDTMREAVTRGGDVNARDRWGRTPLMSAAMVDTATPASIQMLLDHGAQIDAKDPAGRTALFFAKRLGATPVVDMLEKAGGTALPEVDPPLAFVKDTSVRAAVQRSIPLLQRTARSFHSKSGCTSCHHNTLTAMTVALARAGGIAVDERAARDDHHDIVRNADAFRDQALQSIVSPGGTALTTGYLLMGLAAERHQPSPATDAMVRLILSRQREDGTWPVAYRPPTEASEFTATAVAANGLRLYGRTADHAANKRSLDAARVWLERSLPANNEDRVFRLLGLIWTGASKDARSAAVRDLVATQRADGGWAQLATLPSDAYATGTALMALREGGMKPGHAVYRKGVDFLLRTQLSDGSWFVRTRSLPTQQYFESGFPHGEHQFISAAATNWATQALTYAVLRGR